jgi:3-deoxy-D-manno-octulosonate 8-phosphate phosphatase (KDO 8-P phosphatase)
MLLILDVDGVLTDGKKYYDNTGKGIYKTFNDKDFTAIKQFKANNWNVVFLSGDMNVNGAVAINRNIDFYSNRKSDGMVDKATFVPLFAEKYKVEPKDMAYIGDDVFDINIMKKVGFPFCPSDSPDSVKQVAAELRLKGGEGVVVRVFEYFLMKGMVTEPTVESIIKLDRDEKF